MMPELTERKPGKVYLVFSRPPGPACDFVESEDDKGKSIRLGKWFRLAGFYALELDDPRARADSVVLSLTDRVAVPALVDYASDLISQTPGDATEAHALSNRIRDRLAELHGLDVFMRPPPNRGALLTTKVKPEDPNP